MRIITFLLALLTLAISAWIWTLNQNTRFLNNQTKEAVEQISAFMQEQDNLSKYKTQAALSLDRFYLEVFNDIKEISSYCHAACEIKIIAAKDMVNTREFFKASRFKGINCVDVLCQIDLKDQLDTYLLDTLCKMLKSRPIEVLEVGLDKNIFNLTLRLYGP